MESKELEEVQRRELGEKLVNIYYTSKNLTLRKEEILEELSKVAPLKIGDSVKIYGYREKYTIETIRPYLNTDLHVAFMYHLRQEGSVIISKYNVDSCQIKKIK